MEQMNKITLCGRVGGIKVSTFGDTKVANISLGTNEVFKNKNGEIVFETTWFSIKAYEGENIDNFDDIKSGEGLYVEGKMKMVKYKSAEGADMVCYEVIPTILQKKYSI